MYMPNLIQWQLAENLTIISISLEWGTFWNMEQLMTNFSHRLPTPHARLVPQPTSQLTPQTMANNSGIAHKSAKTLKFRLDASLLNIKHGVNRFKLTALRDFWTDRLRMPFLERIHPPKAITTTSKVDS
jgi:hypothetical protein